MKVLIPSVGDYWKEIEVSDEEMQKIIKLSEARKKGYTHVCPKGFTDCVCDPAYIKYIDPEWYNELYGDLTPQEAADRHCNVEDEDCYDDEDK